jgi:DNA primase
MGRATLWFGGRVLDDSLPKYLNTPQDARVRQSAVLYGIDWRGKPSSIGVAIVVEAIRMWSSASCGVEIWCCMGTALTEEQRDPKTHHKKLILARTPTRPAWRRLKVRRRAQQGL